MDDLAQTHSSSGDRLLTTLQAAKMIGVKPIAVLLLSRAGCLPCAPTREGLRFRLADVVPIARRHWEQLMQANHH